MYILRPTSRVRATEGMQPMKSLRTDGTFVIHTLNVSRVPCVSLACLASYNPAVFQHGGAEPIENCDPIAYMRARYVVYSMRALRTTFMVRSRTGV